MALSKKYAGLPDLDPAPEIYETPDLTDDASTIQTNTLRTESPSPSEQEQATENFDRARLNQDEARRRFEPTVVDARETNLSDVIGSNRKGYKISYRRRRRRRRADGVEEYGDISGESSEEEETLSKKLARLRREAEEIRLELASREKEAEDEEFKDSYEHHQNGDRDDEVELTSGVDELSRVLNSLKVSPRQTKGETLEQEFSRKLAMEGIGGSRGQGTISKPVDSTSTDSTSISAIAAFADRLTALETALGISALPTTAETGPILPTLSSLSSQITVLTKTMSPPPPIHFDTAIITTTPIPYLDEVQSRLQTLQSESEALLATRKAALQTLSSLHDTHSRASNNSAIYNKYISSKRNSYQQHNHDSGLDNNEQKSRPQSQSQDSPIDSSPDMKIYTPLFLQEQSTKISALYNTLSTIQSLQPLLPLVLERLRGLNVIHAGAATAQRDMNELEGRLDLWEKEMKKWKDAVEGVEKGIEEGREAMKDNVELMKGLVGDVEERIEDLERGTRRS